MAPTLTSGAATLAENFSALPIRLAYTWRSSTRSPLAGGMGPTSMRVRGYSARSSSHTDCASACMSTLSKAMAWREVRASFSMASISAPMRSALFSITESWRRPSADSRSASPARSRLAKPPIARSGARRSCETEYENDSSSR